MNQNPLPHAKLQGQILLHVVALGDLWGQPPYPMGTSNGPMHGNTHQKPLKLHTLHFKNEPNG